MHRHGTAHPPVPPPPPNLRRPLRVPQILPRPQRLQNTWHWTAVRYRNTSAYDIVNALCMLRKFKQYLLVLGLKTLDILRTRRSQGDVNI